MSLIPLLPLLLLEMGSGNAGGWGKGPVPSPAADLKASLSSCLPPGSLSVQQRYLAVSTVPQAKKAIELQCSCPWFWESRQVAAGPWTCRDPLQWPSPAASMASGWSFHSPWLEIRGAKLLEQPGPVSNALPQKPLQLLLGIAACSGNGQVPCKARGGAAVWAELEFTSMARVWLSIPELGRNLPGQRQWISPAPSGQPSSELLLMSLHQGVSGAVGVLLSSEGARQAARRFIACCTWPDQGYCGAWAAVVPSPGQLQLGGSLAGRIY